MVKVLPQGVTTIPELNGIQAPHFVYINYNDHAYCKTLLDEISLNFLMNNLHLIQGPLLRQLLWNTVQHMLRDARFKATDYLKLFIEKIPFENNTKLMESVLG